MTMHKYLTIVYQWDLTAKHVSGMIAACWFLPLSLAPLFLIPNNTLAGLKASNVYCLIAMDSTEPFNVIMTIIILANITLTLLIIIIAHAHIFMKYREWKKPGRNVQERLKKESILIKKSVAIAGLYTFQWAFYIYHILYELSTHRQVPPDYDTFWVFVAATLPMLNLLILYLYDAKFKHNVLDFLCSMLPRSVRGKNVIELQHRAADAAVQKSNVHGKTDEKAPPLPAGTVMIQYDTATEIVPRETNPN